MLASLFLIVSIMFQVSVLLRKKTLIMHPVLTLIQTELQTW